MCVCVGGEREREKVQREREREREREEGAIHVRYIHTHGRVHAVLCVQMISDVAG